MAYSDALLNPQKSPGNTPDYHLFRHVTTNDAAEAPTGYLPATITEKHACTFGDKALGTIQAIQRTSAVIGGTPGGAGAVTVKMYEWSPGAARFVYTGVSWVAGGAGQPVVGTIDARGRKLFFAVTGLAGAESCSIYLSSSDLSAKMS